MKRFFNLALFVMLSTSAMAQTQYALNVYNSQVANVSTFRQEKNATFANEGVDSLDQYKGLSPSDSSFSRVVGDINQSEFSVQTYNFWNTDSSFVDSVSGFKYYVSVAFPLFSKTDIVNITWLDSSGIFMPDSGQVKAYYRLYGGNQPWVLITENVTSFNMPAHSQFMQKPIGYVRTIAKGEFVLDTTSSDSSSISIEEFGNFSGVGVYPNPTRGDLNINAENFKGVSLYDINGRQVFQSSQKRNRLPSLPKGFYIARIENTLGNVKSLSVILR